MLTARNPIGAKPGQLVTVESASAPVLAAAAVLYLMPLVLFFVGYLAFLTTGKGAFFGGIGFLLGIALVLVYDRRVASKRKAEYTITGIVSENQEQRG